MSEFLKKDEIKKVVEKINEIWNTNSELELIKRTDEIIAKFSYDKSKFDLDNYFDGICYVAIARSLYPEVSIKSLKYWAKFVEDEAKGKLYPYSSDFLRLI